MFVLLIEVTKIFWFLIGVRSVKNPMVGDRALWLKKLLSEPLQLKEDDPERNLIEQCIALLDEEQIISLFVRTRKAAAQSKREKSMDDLFLYVRACKTIQRIADERSIILSTEI